MAARSSRSATANAASPRPFASSSATSSTSYKPTSPNTPSPHARNHPTIRQRRLLLHRSELERLHDAVQQQGLTLIPLSLYAKTGLIKLELALCRGKKLHDKRATIKERESKREMARAIRDHR
jgi:tmRNA-binding protein